MRTWIIDDNGNKASIEKWGDEEKARASLATLTRCSRCSDCFGCFDCLGCFGCFDCSGCSGCSRCSDCSRCSRCFGCSDCFDCLDCSGCSGCFGCSGCSGEKREFSVPKIEGIHQKLLAAVSAAPNCLDMGEWHKCETTHCRAGWVVHLAGVEGYALEKETSTLFAAQQIYKASGFEISPCRFFESDENAMSDIKKLAETN